jgi:hypothetical protein
MLPQRVAGWYQGCTVGEATFTTVPNYRIMPIPPRELPAARGTAWPLFLPKSEANVYQPVHFEKRDSFSNTSLLRGTLLGA